MTQALYWKEQGEISDKGRTELAVRSRCTVFCCVVLANLL